ncbi:hypothetical protein ACIO1C_33080 [Streptomyces sp. NPDC087420]|uniref:hypothetical protein n=1 Tax=Streptomyces sp. NPDC087420 TaxID=3365785 RepID=UPI0038357038
MTAAHRPLTVWVQAARTARPGPLWAAHGPVNDGDERADARHMARFSTGWERCALPLADGGHGLGLTEPATGEAVLELDDFGRPLPAEPATAGAVAAIERRWPAHRLEPDEEARLHDADPGLRYSLLDRLAAEGRPGPECFHVLPWERVDRLADQVTAALASGGPPVPDPVRLHHYFAPAGSRFTAALEQLAFALSSGDPRLRRVATTALCARLAGAATGRVPQTTRERLRLLLDAVGRDDAFLHATAALAADRLAGAFPTPYAPPEPDGRAIAWRTLAYGRAASVRNRFAPAADAGSTGSEDTVRRAPFTLTLNVRSTGRLYVTVTAPLDPATTDLLARAYDEVLLLPVQVTGAAEGHEVYVLLRSLADRLAGDLEMTATTEPDITADQAGPPLGPADLPSLDPEAVRRTLACQVRESDRRRWRGLLERLPDGHPVRRAMEGG